MVDRIGDFHLIEELGRGGIGTVYRARQGLLDREVALKVLSPTAREDGDFQRRFLREMKVAAGLSHPNLVRVFDAGTVQDTAYIAMELVPGETLEASLKARSPLPWPIAVRIASRVAAALAHLHAQDIIHRDVKPSNIMVSPDDRVRLLDLGIVHCPGLTALTAPGIIVGTLNYMAPELMSGAPPTSAADLWSLGGVLYVMLTGRAHASLEDVCDWIEERRSLAIIPPVELRPELPAALSELVMHLLHVDPKERPDASGTLRTLDSILASLAEPPAPAPAAPPSPARPGRAGWRPLIGITTACLVGIGLWRLDRDSVRPIPPIEPIPASRLPLPRGTGLTHSFLAQWELVLPQLGQLRQGGNPARQAIADLRSQVSFDFGHAPAPWIQWVRLGQWLRTPDRSDPPHYDQHEPGPLGPLEESWLAEFVGPAKGPTSLTCIMAVKLTGLFPRDARGWLLLGRLLELGECQPQADRTYGQALERFAGASLSGSPDLVWEGFARALLRVSRGRYPQRFWSASEEVPQDPKPWRVLLTQVRPVEPELFERILASVLHDPRRGAIAAVHLGDFYMEIRKDSARALSTWNEAFMAGRQHPTLLTRLATYYLRRGDLMKTQQILSSIPADDPLRGPHAYAAAGALPRGKPFPAAPADLSGCPIQHVLFLAEVGDTAGAEQLLAKLRHDGGVAPAGFVWLELMLLGAGSRAGWIASDVRDALFRRPGSLSLWTEASGFLSTPPGREWMEEFLRAPVGSLTGPALARTRALFRSRSQDLALAATELAKAGDPGKRAAGISLAAFEVQLRALCLQAMDDPAARGVPIATDAALGPSKAYQSVWAAAVRGDFRSASQIAQEMVDKNPELESAIALLFCGAAASRNVEELTALTRRVRAILRIEPRFAWLLPEVGRIEEIRQSRGFR